MDVRFLVKLTARRWALPILSALHRGTPGRQAALITATGASRAGFLDSLAHLQSLNLVQRNSGHGHPLRPEYLISQEGRRWADKAEAVLGKITQVSEFKTMQRHWALPVLVIAQDAQYFGDLRRKLDPVTDRALSQTLHGLGAVNWISREIDNAARPPRACYRSVKKGADIARILMAV